jgi:lipopolysaccharide transport system ATP-binding protein
LTDVSFDLPKGHSMGVIGLNGSGKSTLLQIIAGTLTPTSGEVKKHGRVAALLELGSGFNPDFTGRENACLNANLLGLSNKEIENRMDDILAFADIGDFIDQPVRTYSSGMVVRLAFSVVAHVDPEILIVDEALAVGDSYFQAKCLRFMRSFSDNGGTLLLVSHDSGAHLALCSKVIMLQEGRIIRSGDAKGVLDYYNAFIAKENEKHTISAERRRDGTGTLRSGSFDLTFEEIELLDMEGKQSDAFVSGESCMLNARLEARKNIEEATIGILLRDLYGREVFGTNTYLLGHTPLAVSVGESRKLQIRVKLDLGPGRYTITIAVHKGKTHTEGNYDWFEDVFVIDVLPPVPMTFSGIALIDVDFHL